MFGVESMQSQEKGEGQAYLHVSLPGLKLLWEL